MRQCLDRMESALVQTIATSTTSTRSQKCSWLIQEVTLDFIHRGACENEEPMTIRDLQACLEAAFSIPRPLSWSEFLLVFGVKLGTDRFTGELAFRDTELVISETQTGTSSMMNSICAEFETPEGGWENDDVEHEIPLSVAIHVVRRRDGASGTIYRRDYNIQGILPGNYKRRN